MSGLEERANQYIEHSQDLPPRFTEDMEYNMFDVPDDLWACWSRQVKLLFNVTFPTLCEAGIEILDEDTMPMPKDQFETMAFNAAGLAASALDVIEKHGPVQKLCQCP